MKKGRQDRIAETLTGIKLLTEEGFTRKRLGNNSLQRGERGEKRKRTLRGK